MATPETARVELQRQRAKFTNEVIALGNDLADLKITYQDAVMKGRKLTEQDQQEVQKVHWAANKSFKI